LVRIPVRNSGGDSVSRGGRKSKVAGGRGGFDRVCSSAWFAEEREKKRERGGHSCAQDGGRRGGDRRALRKTVARARQDSRARLERRVRAG
jgi:hypothetical protein